MRFWKKKTTDDANAQVEGDFDLVPSLAEVGKDGGLKPWEMFLSIVYSPGNETDRPNRKDIIIGDGSKLAGWQVDSLQALFRGNRQPPPDSEMEYYPEAYVAFFYRIEYNVYRYCRTMGLNPTDEEFLDIYSQMRRQPDGRSKGPLHDIVWQSAALVLGLRPWSEAEYTAVFGQLVRSARHFRMGPSSRNYIEYVRTMQVKEE